MEKSWNFSLKDHHHFFPPKLSLVQNIFQNTVFQQVLWKSSVSCVENALPGKQLRASQFWQEHLHPSVCHYIKKLVFGNTVPPCASLLLNKIYKELLKNPTLQNNNLIASGSSRNKQSLVFSPSGVKVLPSFTASCTPGPAVAKTGAGEKNVMSSFIKYPISLLTVIHFFSDISLLHPIWQAL